jgi:CheY-like chemotaxis protein
MSGYTPPSLLPPRSSPSIILVDDERDILSACLPSSCKGTGNMMSMHFLTLQRQLTLLQIQTRFCFALVITDLKMPQMNGIKLLHIASGAQRKVKIIFDDCF